ncbi:penicillin acylase family protein [Brucella sp. LJL56]
MNSQHISNEYKIAGIGSTISIKVDQWGVAHIEAANLYDLFFAQGWNVARDRLWQIDIARKRGLGLLARDFGPGYLEQDRASRLFLYRGGMDAEWKAYGPNSEEICTAFTHGINAYIDGCDAGNFCLPPEFELLGNRPDRWKPEDVVRVRTHSLTRNASSEALRSKIFALAGGQLASKLDGLRKKLSHSKVPEPVDGFDPAIISDRVLRDFQLAVSPATFSNERLAVSLEEAQSWTSVLPTGEIARASFEEGSNNWAISGDKTATGRPILALDPHRTHVLPSIRYVVHLAMPGFDVVGAGEPMVPGISMGHNGTAAFGLTIFGADQEDIYFYETSEDDPSCYFYKGGWEKFKIVEERLPVKGYDDQKIELKFTRHGPVIYEDRANNRAFSLRTVWMDAGMAPYMASLAVMRARNYADYTAALEGWGCPSVNHVYADTSNTIAWKPSGAAPIRKNWDGLMPVPGDGRYEWEGYLSPSETPAEINPERGFIATANAMNIPDEWTKNNVPIGYEWLDSSRHDTLHQKLASEQLLTLQDSIRLQASTVSPIAVRILGKLKEVSEYLSNEPSWQLLELWNGDLEASSSSAALFEVWLTKHLGPFIAKLEGADDKVLPLLLPLDPPSVAEWIENATFDGETLGALRQTLAAAFIECSQLLGQKPSEWSWGQLHKLHLYHPLQKLTDHNWSPGPVALGGSGSTLNYATYRLSDFNVIGGPSVRMVIDVGGWDNSLFINNPGQSGVPGSVHFADLGKSWQDCELKPLLYSRDKIEAHTTAAIKLVPADRKIRQKDNNR